MKKLPIKIIFLCWSMQAFVINAEEVAVIKKQILAAEDSYVKGEITRNEKLLNSMVDERFIFNLSNGTTMDKKGLIEEVMQLPMVDQKLSQRSVLLEGNIGVIFGTTEIFFKEPGKEKTRSKYRYTSIYINRGKGWRMVGLQMQKFHKDH